MHVHMHMHMHMHMHVGCESFADFAAYHAQAETEVLDESILKLILLMTMRPFR